MMLGVICKSPGPEIPRCSCFIIRSLSFVDPSQDSCQEEKILYKLISGLHSSISIHIAADYLLDEATNLVNVKLLYSAVANFLFERDICIAFEELIVYSLYCLFEHVGTPYTAVSVWFCFTAKSYKLFSFPLL